MRSWIVRLLAGISALAAVFLSFLWYRSTTTINVLAWTTSRPDPAEAVLQFPSEPSVFPHPGAWSTFAILSTDGQIEFKRATILHRDDRAEAVRQRMSTSDAQVLISPAPTPGEVVPYPFKESPSMFPRYGVISHGAPHGFRFAGFQTTAVPFAVALTGGWMGPTFVHRSESLLIPHWAPVAVLLLPAGFLMTRMVLRRRRRGPGLCPECGYDLRASLGRCPECGTETGTSTPPAGASHQ